MSTFKSWLVANIEVILVIGTIILLIVETLMAIAGYKKTGEDTYYAKLLYGGIVAIVLCIFIISLIKSGPGAFISLLLIAGFITFCAISSNKKTEESEAVVIEKTQMASTEESENDATTQMLDRALERFNPIWLILIAAAALVFGIFNCVYAYRNFDDVVSLRFFYRNSSVSIFEVQWKYAFSRFYAGFMTVAAIGMEVMLFALMQP